MTTSAILSPAAGTSSSIRYNEREAAPLVGVNVRTLQAWRQQGRGPRFLKIGGFVRYTQEALDEFLAGCAVHSTSEYIEKQAKAKRAARRKVAA